MKDNPSMTASRAAVRRAAHQLWDRPKVFDDPLALKIIGAEDRAQLQPQAPQNESYISRTVRAFMAARSRVTEDEIAAAVARGVRQYVVLGAGLDTFAFRNPTPDLRVFEIDHPATQIWKQARLHQCAIAVPESVTFVPVDFMTQKLADELKRAGWDSTQPTFFSWLGVTNYLSPAAVMETLSFVASCPKKSGIVFDVSTPDSQVSFLERLVRLAVSIRVMLAGETTGTRFDPATLARDIRALGFGEVDTYTAKEINAKYFAGRSDNLAVSNRSAMIRAIV